jgi:hypothetical protein
VTKEVAFDEWLLDWLADLAKCVHGLGVLQCTAGRDLRIVSLRGSPFAEKLYALSRRTSDWEPRRRMVTKYFFREFVTNPRRLRWIEGHDLPPLPLELRDRIPEEDVYIVRTALAAVGRLLVTTDGELLDATGGSPHLAAVSADEFIRTSCVPEYFASF